MDKVGRFLSWLFLAPYFATWALPIRPAFTNDIEIERRWRAQGVIMFGLIIILLGLLSLSGHADLLTSLPYLWVAALSWLLGILLIFAMGATLTRKRERRLKANYDSMPRWKRRTFTGIAWTFVAAMFLAILWFGGPSQSQPITDLHCDTSATEITAETCSSQSAR